MHVNDKCKTGRGNKTGIVVEDKRLRMLESGIKLVELELDWNRLV